jgi:Cytochrome c oxidase caa3 assembly factor (Caa3_CtaG)
VAENSPIRTSRRAGRCRSEAEVLKLVRGGNHSEPRRSIDDSAWARGLSNMTWHYPATIPYCGPPPSPASLLVSWNLDPVLIAGLVAFAGLYIIGGARLDRSGRGLRLSEKAAFHTGWLMAALALLSPLCPLSVSLFAARVGQHMVLALVAAPLEPPYCPKPRELAAYPSNAKEEPARSPRLKGCRAATRGRWAAGGGVRRGARCFGARRHAPDATGCRSGLYCAALVLAHAGAIRSDLRQHIHLLDNAPHCQRRWKTKPHGGGIVGQFGIVFSDGRDRVSALARALTG